MNDLGKEYARMLVEGMSLYVAALYNIQQSLRDAIQHLETAPQINMALTRMRDIDEAIAASRETHNTMVGYAQQALEGDFAATCRDAALTALNRIRVALNKPTFDSIEKAKAEAGVVVAP